MERAVAASPVRTFLIQAVLWNLALFALLRLAWTDQHLVAALVDFQKTIVNWYGVKIPAGLAVTSSCSGADVMALCIGVTLAYPSVWRRRLIGAAGGIAVILALNVVRISTLSAVAGSFPTLNLLHVYVWPAVLTFVTVIYVFLWIRWSERSPLVVSRTWVRLLMTSAACLFVYAAAVQWVLTSQPVQRVGVWTAGVAGALLSAAGAPVTTTGAILQTTRGAFQVTQECLFTPVLPLYFASVFAFPLARRRRLMWIAMAAPVFFALGVARLMVLAAPSAVVGAPLFIAHGFYQLAAAVVIIIGAAHLSTRQKTARESTRRTAVALVGAVVIALVAGRLWTMGVERLVHVVHDYVPSSLATLRPAGDVQGALAILPAYQLALVTGLWLAISGGRSRRRFLTALAVLVASQLAFVAIVGAASARFAVAPHALVFRGWAIVLPLLFIPMFVSLDGTRVGDRRYRRFWQDVAETFPDLSDASSTVFYLENEKRLLRETFLRLEGISILKTDLWDEAKNTRILKWAASEGAKTFGIDLSEPMVRHARAEFRDERLYSAVSDVRRLPFADGSFDAIYSMGTVEHFAETTTAVGEIARVLKPGGRVILGVPNRHDPFLRPLLVSVLYPLGLYGYGFEKSYSRRELRAMLEQTGLVVERETAILFMPGWLRMLDLWCHTRARPLASITSALIKPFVWLDRHVPSLRRHGYLLASVAVKPASSDHAGTARPAIVADLGVEYVVDARGCDPAKLRSLPALQQLFDEILADLSLLPAAAPVWHVFTDPPAVTGLVLLTESHLTIHTYPEERVATINLYCCRPRAAWPWEPRLRAHLGASEVRVRVLRRGLTNG